MDGNVKSIMKDLERYSKFSTSQELMRILDLTDIHGFKKLDSTNKGTYLDAIFNQPQYNDISFWTWILWHMPFVHDDIIYRRLGEDFRDNQWERMVARGLLHRPPLLAPSLQRAFNLIEFFGYFLPGSLGEAFVGDVNEKCMKLLKKGYSKWSILLVIAGNGVVMLWAIFKMRFSDYLGTFKKRTGI